MEHQELFAVPLTKGYVAWVDAADARLVSGFSWNAQVCRNGLVYARRSEYVGVVSGRARYKTIYMHRELCADVPPWLLVDHRDGNGLNNTRKNLRVANRQGNAANSRKQGDLPRGSTFHKGAFQVSITVEGKSIYLGRTKDARRAAEMYDEAATKHFGEFANLNNKGEEHADRDSGFSGRQRA